MMLLAVVALVACSTLTRSSQVCSLYSTPPSVEGVLLFDYPSFEASTPLVKTWTSVVDNKLRLAAHETNGGTVGYAWHSSRDRIADGFVSQFTFQLTTPDWDTVGDGFTYFIQNDKVIFGHTLSVFSY
jgi:hypothetical protein